MGSWDVGSFDNDTASDWALDFAGSGDLSPVEGSLSAVVDAGADYLEASAAEEALAAAEVVARLKGNWGKRDAYSEPVDQWVEAHPQVVAPELVGLALRAIDRVGSEPSELLEQWSESDADEWKSSVADLRGRVAA